MKIVIASDHAGVGLKTEIISMLEEKKIVTINVGTDTITSVDYPDFAHQAALKIQEGVADLGIVICGTGIGISIAANKHKGIRCALCHDTFSARMAREHNDSNILALGARVIGVDLAKDIVEAFLHSYFVGGRHSQRIKKMSDIEETELIRGSCK